MVVISEQQPILLLQHRGKKFFAEAGESYDLLQMM